MASSAEKAAERMRKRNDRTNEWEQKFHCRRFRGRAPSLKCQQLHRIICSQHIIETQSAQGKERNRIDRIQAKHKQTAESDEGKKSESKRANKQVDEVKRKQFSHSCSAEQTNRLLSFADVVGRFMNMKCELRGPFAAALGIASSLNPSVYQLIFEWNETFYSRNESDVD